MIRELTQRTAGRTAVGLHHWLGRRAHPSLGILVYHRIAAPTAGLSRPTLNVSPPRFRTQLIDLLNRGYEFWPLHRAIRHCREGRPLGSNIVVITFDDAYESVYLHAWPVLKELNLPATCFISTAFLDRSEPFPFDDWGIAHQGQAPATDYRPLTAAQCEEMLVGGLMEIGSHTHTHQDFRGRPQAFGADLQQSLEHLAQRFGIQQPAFAFPYGRVHLGYAGGALTEIARRAGVTCALTTEAQPVAPDSNPWEWGRFNAYQWDTGRTLAAKLAGWYGWAPRLHERLSRRSALQNGLLANQSI